MLWYLRSALISWPQSVLPLRLAYIFNRRSELKVHVLPALKSLTVAEMFVSQLANTTRLTSLCNCDGTHSPSIVEITLDTVANT